MSVQRAQYEIPSSEFVEWIAYFDDEVNHPTIEHYYLAQIAARITGLFKKDPNDVKTENFLLKFVNKLKAKKLTKEEATAISKANWSVADKYKGKS